MRRISILVFLLVVFSAAFSFVIQPFGLFGNVELVRHDLTALIKVVPFVEFELGQNILTLDNINALLNEEQVNINESAFADALANGFKLSAPISLGTYLNLKLGALRLVPYVRVDGNISLELPKTFAELLVEDTLIDHTYNDTKEELSLTQVSWQMVVLLYCLEISTSQAMRLSLFFSATRHKL